MNKGFETEEGLIVCEHWKSFPPKGARTPMKLTPTEQQQLDVWARVCGLLEMAEKCSTCPHRMQVVIRAHVPYFVKTNGVTVPVVDPVLVESLGDRSSKATMDAAFRRGGSL